MCVCLHNVLRSWAQSLSIRVSSPQKDAGNGYVVLAWRPGPCPGSRGTSFFVPGTPGDIVRYVCGQEAGPGWLSWLAGTTEDASVVGRTVGFTAPPELLTTCTHTTPLMRLGPLPIMPVTSLV